MLVDSGRTGVAAATAELRRKHADTLANMEQERVVDALARLASCWRDPEFPCRKAAEALIEPFPFRMVWPTLDALLKSLSPEHLWNLIDADGVRDAFGYPLTGHVVAGNTPLLSWTTMIRALLVRSASLVKLSSRAGGDWAALFHESLRDCDPDLADCIALATWPGGTLEADTALCRSVDAVMAYGGDEALASLRGLCPDGTPFIGYGHRVSFGLALSGFCSWDALHGFAVDTLAFDQGGCLSPQTIFVEGDWSAALAFAEEFAAVLEAAAKDYPVAGRPMSAASAVQNARGLAKMSEDCVVWGGERLRWTVIARKTPLFAPSPAYCVISVQPLLTPDALDEAVAPVRGHLQGCAVAVSAGARSIPEYLALRLRALGVSRICAPGELQTPPLSWRQDGRAVLSSLIPGAPALE